MLNNYLYDLLSHVFRKDSTFFLIPSILLLKKCYRKHLVFKKQPCNLVMNAITKRPVYFKRLKQ